jgi:hypothetical protein
LAVDSAARNSNDLWQDDADMSRFSLLYLNDGIPEKDNQFFRNRLASYIDDVLKVSSENIRFLRVEIEKETGVTLIYSPSNAHQIATLFQRANLRHVLDAITIIFRSLNTRFLRHDAVDWLAFCRRVLKEENIAYRIDDQGVVHPLVDEEFQRNRISTLALLDASRFAAVKTAFDQAFQYLETDTKSAVRCMYEALEILCRLLKPAAPRLSEQLVRDLHKQYESLYPATDAAGRTTFNAVMESIVKWVVGLQVQRHGQPTMSPLEPDAELCAHILSTGSAHIRWLIELDNKLAKK